MIMINCIAKSMQKKKKMFKKQHSRKKTTQKFKEKSQIKKQN